MQKKLCDLVLSLIPTGKNNAIRMQRLAVIAGTNPRNIRQIIFDANVSGDVIIGDNRGYYRPAAEDREELKHFYYANRKRALSSFRRIKSARQLLRSSETDEAMAEMAEILRNGEKK